MSKYQEEEKRVRRRQRDIAFFDHGHDSESPSGQIAKDEEEQVKQGVRKATKGYLGYLLSLARLLLTTFAAVFLILTFIGFSLRSLGYACKHIPFSLPYCSWPSIALQEQLINSIEPGTTPITKILHELEKLNNISTSLEFTPLAMHLIATNVSETISEFKKNPGVYQIDKNDTESLAQAVGSSFSNVSKFHNEDYFYRHSTLIWGNNGISSIGIKNHINLDYLNASSSTDMAITEHILYKIPFGVTLAAHCMNDYFYFSGEQWLSIEKIVKQAGQTTLALSDLLSSLGKLERRLQDVVSQRKRFCASEHAENATCAIDPSHALDTAVTTRAAILWVCDVIKVAESHYKDLFYEVGKATNTLQAEVKSYGTWIPSKKELALHQLEELMRLEHTQIVKFTENQGRVENLTAEVNKQLMSGNAENQEMTHKFEAALQRRRIANWW